MSAYSQLIGFMAAPQYFVFWQLGKLGVESWPEVPPYRLCSCVTRWHLPSSSLERLNPKRFVTFADFWRVDIRSAWVKQLGDRGSGPDTRQWGHHSPLKEAVKLPRETWRETTLLWERPDFVCKGAYLVVHNAFVPCISVETHAHITMCMKHSKSKYSKRAASVLCLQLIT